MILIPRPRPQMSLSRMATQARPGLERSRLAMTVTMTVMRTDHQVIDLDVAVDDPGADFDRSGRQGKGLTPSADLADILGEDEIDGDELGGHGGEDQVEPLDLG